jgi:hypothetical protein
VSKCKYILQHFYLNITNGKNFRSKTKTFNFSSKKKMDRTTSVQTLPFKQRRRSTRVCALKTFHSSFFRIDKKIFFALLWNWPIRMHTDDRRKSYSIQLAPRFTAMGQPAAAEDRGLHLNHHPLFSTGHGNAE